MGKEIFSVVEGKGEVKSLPASLTRLLASWKAHDLFAGTPNRVHRDQFVQPGQLENWLHTALQRRVNAGAVLVLLDADNDCPAQLAPMLLDRARTVTRLPVAVVLAAREFENWFVGSLESFRGFSGITEDAISPRNPEERDGKGQLRRAMKGLPYDSVRDQAEFAKRMDLDLCRKNCPSFDKFVREVERLVKTISG
jgi:hypothetical protein